MPLIEGIFTIIKDVELTFIVKEETMKRKSTKKKVNRKMYKAAFRSIFSRLINEERLVDIDSLEINEPPKTSSAPAFASCRILFKLITFHFDIVQFFPLTSYKGEISI